MGHGHQKKIALLTLVLAFGLLLLGAAIAAEQAAPARTAESMVKLKPFGPEGPACDPNDYYPVPNDKMQVVSIYIDPNTSPRSIKFEGNRMCVQESVNGSLTFKVALLPTDYQLEIDFVTRPDTSGNPHKGPFKSKKRTAKYPVAGRCMMSKSPSDSCVFDKHDKSLPTGEAFQFSVFLWDEDGNLVDEVDPGVMVIDNP